MTVIPRRTADRAYFKILRAFKNPKIPWGITAEGWRFFLGHPHPVIREAAEVHPYSGRPVQKRRDHPVEFLPSDQQACA